MSNLWRLLQIHLVAMPLYRILLWCSKKDAMYQMAAQDKSANAKTGEEADKWDREAREWWDRWTEVYKTKCGLEDVCLRELGYDLKGHCHNAGHTFYYL